MMTPEELRRHGIRMTIPENDKDSNYILDILYESDFPESIKLTVRDISKNKDEENIVSIILDAKTFKKLIACI